MADTQEDDVVFVFENLSSTNQRLMREMEEFLSSVDIVQSSSEVRTSAARPQATAYGNPRSRSAEGCDDKRRETYLRDINEDESTEDHDLEAKLQRINDTKDELLNFLRRQAQKRKQGEYEYYNDPMYQRQTRDHSFDDDSLVELAKRLDEASIISDPSVICGTREKFPLITNQRNNGKSSKNHVSEKTRSDKAVPLHSRPRRRSSTSSTSASPSHISRDGDFNASNNSTRYKTENSVPSSMPAAAGKDSKSSSHYYKRTYISESVDHRKKENYRKSKATPSYEFKRKSSGSKVTTTVPTKHDHNGSSDSRSRRTKSPIPTDNGYACAQKDPSRACYSDFRGGIASSQDSNSEDGGEESDHTEFFYESTDEDEYDAVGSSVADAVKDLNNQRGLKRVMNIFGKKSKGEDDLWSVTTQR